MFSSLIKKIISSPNDSLIKKLQRVVLQINKLEDGIRQLSDSGLRNKTQEFKNRLTQGESIDNILPEAFAVVRETTRRVLGTRHFDVQLIGGMVLHRGMVAEMRTGEGKTQVAALAAYLNGLLGKGVHVVTINDYLAERDSQWMSKVYNFLGLTVGCIRGDTSEEDRRAAYNADITYGTNNEFGFDFLRDNLKYNSADLVQRPYYYAIVDEADSVLIDEARTPLVISGPAEDNAALYIEVDKIARNLQRDYYQIDEKQRTVILTDLGNEKIDQIFVKNGLIKENTSIYDLGNMMMAHYLIQALRAHHLYKKDVAYLVRDRKLLLIDEFTGRIMEGRRYSEGLHQALEAKESIDVLSENQTIASITFQNYFRMYPKLAGMTGTAATESTELREIYKLDVAKIPTNIKMIRQDMDDIIYKTANEKYRALIDTILEAHNRGQPILVGTVSVEKSEYLSRLLKKSNINHNVLNAKHHEQEAKIIAQAGRFGALTIATNMAGRGTDIMLGGNADMLFRSILVDPKFSSNSNTHRLYEEHQLSKNNLCFKFDDLCKLSKEISNEKDEVIKKKKIEDLRQKVYQYVEEEKRAVKENGGLLVIGTERHESRRIDDQLRGRSGRQGDPGGSVFFLSLEDDLMRIFGSEKLGEFLTKLGLKEGEAIVHPWISKSLRKAQQRVEMSNYGVRKSLLQFDDVMNEQRQAVYSQRNKIMNNPEVLIDAVYNIIYVISDNLIKQFIPTKSYKEEWDAEGLNVALSDLLGVHCDLREFISEDGVGLEEVRAKLIELSRGTIEQKLRDTSADRNALNQAIQSIFLMTLDQFWKDHLHNLDHLRAGIGLRAYGQKDPLMEYKFEAFDMFKAMLDVFEEQVLRRIARMRVVYDIESEHHNGIFDFFKQRAGPTKAHNNARKVQFLHGGSDIDAHRETNDRYNMGQFIGERLSRNQLCPCNSGKKYKYCHGAIK